MNRRDVQQLVNDFGDAQSQNHDFSHVYDDLHTLVKDSRDFNEYSQNIRAVNQALVQAGLIPEIVVNGRTLPEFYLIGADDKGHIMTGDPGRQVLQLRDEGMNVLGEARPPVITRDNQGQPQPNDNGSNQPQPSDNGNVPPQNDAPSSNGPQDWNGRQFEVAPDGSATYTVVSGDTVSAVAADVMRHRLGRAPSHAELWNEVSEIARASHLANANLIYPGDKLVIPGQGSQATNDQTAPPEQQQYQPQANGNPVSSGSGGSSEQAITKAASTDVGKKMWTNYGDTQNGVLGCAAAVSEVLQQSGFSYANSEGVRGLQKQLEAQGWTATAQPRAGDVVVGYRTNPDASTGGGAHTGIVGPDSTVYNNNSNSGNWEQMPLGYFSANEFPSGVTFLRPPGTSTA